MTDEWNGLKIGDWAQVRPADPHGYGGMIGTIVALLPNEGILVMRLHMNRNDNIPTVTAPNGTEHKTWTIDTQPQYVRMLSRRRSDGTRITYRKPVAA